MSTSRSATTRRRWAPSAGSTADDVRRQGEEIAAANELLAPFRVLRGIECDILPDGRLDLPDDVLAELDWVQASVHGGQRMPRREMTKRVEEALRNPYVQLPQPSHRPATSAAARRTPSTSSACSRSRSSTAWRSRSTACPPASICSGEHVREALRAGVRSSAPPTRTRCAGSRTWRSRCAPRAADGRRRRTSSTPARSSGEDHPAGESRERDGAGAGGEQEPRGRPVGPAGAAVVVQRADGDEDPEAEEPRLVEQEVPRDQRADVDVRPAREVELDDTCEAAASS